MRHLLPVLTAAALALAACGGDDGGSSEAPKAAATPIPTAGAASPGPSPSPSATPLPDWAATAVKRCGEATAEEFRLRDATVEEHGEGRRAGAIFVEGRLPIQRRLLADLAELDVPASIARDYDAWLATLGSSLDLFDELAATIRGAGGEDGAAIRKRFQETYAASIEFARKHGVTACVQGPIAAG